MEESRYILFEKYINNELSTDALKSFEDNLLRDDDFKQEFEIYKALESSLSSKFEHEEAEKSLRDTLSNLSEKYKSKEKNDLKETRVISLFRYKKLMVAASIAVLIGLFVFNNGDPVYSDFANHQSLELTVRGDQSKALSEAEKAFNAKNYNEALIQLTALSKSYSNDTEINLYKGICLLELNNYSEAQAIFDSIKQGTSAFANTATWYTALTLLKQENFDECKEVLETIPSSSEHFDQAGKLLRKL